VLHEAANEVRWRVSKAYMQMDETDRNTDLSGDGKYRERGKIADEAIADFEASETLARAREAVELAVAKHKFEEDVSPEIAQDREAALKAIKELERAWQRAMDKIAERASLTKCAAISPSRQSGTGCRQVITLRVEGNRLRERAGSSTRNDRDGVKNRVSLPRHPEQSELLWRFFTAG
jgi:hypothetical protein